MPISQNTLWSGLASNWVRDRSKEDYTRITVCGQTEEKDADSYIPQSIVVSDGGPKNVRPGDMFNDKCDPVDALTSAGWIMAFSDGERDHWRRPGKSLGTSATYHRRMNLFHVFSSNALPFESEKAYRPFSVHTLLKHSGDFTASAKDLVQQGYGTPIIRKSEKPTLVDVEQFLNERYEFRRNVVTSDIEMKRDGEPAFRVVTDIDLNSLHRKLIHAELPISFEVMVRTLRSDFSAEYDPFVSYFEQLPAWDETTDYVGMLVETVEMKNPDDKVIFKEYLTRWIVAQVACSIYPKVVNQTAIVLVGAQGKGKTTWLDRLIPPGLEDYQYLGPIDPHNKDTLGYLAKKALINLDELETFSKRDIGRLKSIMTQSHISVRQPYARVSEQMIRRASFVASVNHGDFLNDPTRSRRFLVFEVASVDGFHNVDMNGVYAQAYSPLRSGHRYYFDQADMRKALGRSSARSGFSSMALV
jgi:hypothetical protein